MPQKTIGGVIENVAYRILGASHDALHSINRAQVVTPIYALSSSSAHQNVLVVIRHADDFMRHDLADGQNQVEATLRNQTVYLRRPGIVQLPFRLLVNELGRNLAQSLYIGSPIV